MGFLEAIQKLSLHQELFSQSHLPKVYDEGVLLYTWFYGITTSSEWLFRVKKESGEIVWWQYSGDYLMISPYVKEGELLFVCVEDYLFAISWDGEDLWAYQHSSPIVPFWVNGSLLFADSVGGIFRFEQAKGKAIELARYQATLPCPVVDNDLVLLVEPHSGLRALHAETLAQRWFVPSQEPVIGRVAVLSTQVLVGPRMRSKIPQENSRASPLVSLSRTTGEEQWRTGVRILEFLVPEGALYAWVITDSLLLGVVELASGRFTEVKQLTDKTPPFLLGDGQDLFLLFRGELPSRLEQISHTGEQLRTLILPLDLREAYSDYYTIHKDKLFFATHGGENPPYPSACCVSLVDGQLLWRKGHRATTQGRNPGVIYRYNAT